MVLTAILGLVAWTAWGQTPPDPHGDPNTGVLRVTTDPSTRGECTQCHPVHQDSWSAPPAPGVLFTENDNRLAFWDQGDGPCHRDRPDNYPLDELDRIPEGFPYAGYFEANIGGVRRPGVQYRGRWPGELIYTDPTVTAQGRYISPHAFDPDMPRRSPTGQGLCLNCHSAHVTPNPFDLLILPYESIGGHNAVGAPDQYRLCFSCHGSDGPAGMDPANQYIEDYYDEGLNGESAGHAIRFNSDVAISWPAHVQQGDKLPCSACHNPHGSEGYNGVEPNAFLISDQRPEWSGLTDTLGDAQQNRRFCLGCHILSDGIPGSREVEGIVMNTLSDRGPHRAGAQQACNFCHGGDYSGPTSNNVHNVDH